ncbi:NADH-quinone oxidoreductase subunit J family protein [Pedosphaera parvula]|uniref:NADH-quinone oxidoreductase subunit J n=1 Tax=Pedosphaera parvula (strain Ellin514) TaxID=320771 RepID=B9XHI4_PEDPL|nr:NADH-quinone oxidoreductase subunit J [Pedosphaera parvula]EEF60819.1 NADH-ubiquinone/plastoquinone oxidoreductase chain 6 [Pedosphaera parvula Ellin514]
MPEYLFYIFAALTLICGAFVIINRNPINSAMCLVLSIGSMAGLFVLLNAFFLGAVQVLVYAGAVMVLFLFVIMLLDLKAEERRRVNLFGAVTGVTSVAAIAFIFYKALAASKDQLPNVTDRAVGGTVELGTKLFSDYLLPFEILSILLLVAMVGVILLSKKDLK